MDLGLLLRFLAKGSDSRLSEEELQQMRLNEIAEKSKQGQNYVKDTPLPSDMTPNRHLEEPYMPEGDPRSNFYEPFYDLKNKNLDDPYPKDQTYMPEEDINNPFYDRLPEEERRRRLLRRLAEGFSSQVGNGPGQVSPVAFDSQSGSY